MKASFSPGCRDKKGQIFLSLPGIAFVFPNNGGFDSYYAACLWREKEMRT